MTWQIFVKPKKNKPTWHMRAYKLQKHCRPHTRFKKYVIAHFYR